MARPSASRNPLRPSFKPRTSPTARVQPRPAPQRHDSREVEAAKKAVAEFEKQLTVLRHMEADWEQAFSEAHEALNTVKVQEDVVESAIRRAKPLVAAAKVTIGDFSVERKWAKPHYDEDEIARLLAKANPAILQGLLKDGVATGVKLEREASVAWFAQRPQFAKVVQPAFRDETEITPAVTVPKV